MPHDPIPTRPRPSYWRLLFFVSVGLADCFLVLAYWPSLADSLESFVFLQSSPSLPLPPSRRPEREWVAPGINQPPTLPADKVMLDADTPVIGVVASGHARAYLVEAFEHGRASHIVNDLLGKVPISVTHCDISECTRVFTGATQGQPLELSAAGLKDGRLVLKFDGHLYRQETSEPLDEDGVPLPCREYPAELTAWGDWRQAHPETDIYMGTVDEPTPH